MDPLGWLQPSAGLSLEERGKKLAFHVLGDQHRNPLLPERHDFLGVVMNGDGTTSKLVELPGIEPGGLVIGISLGKEQLGGTLDSGILLPDHVDLTLPAAAEARYDLVFPGQNPAGLQIEGFDGFRFHHPIV